MDLETQLPLFPKRIRLGETPPSSRVRLLEPPEPGPHLVHWVGEDCRVTQIACSEWFDGAKFQPAHSGKYQMQWKDEKRLEPPWFSDFDLETGLWSHTLGPVDMCVFRGMLPSAATLPPPMIPTPSEVGSHATVYLVMAGRRSGGEDVVGIFARRGMAEALLEQCRLADLAQPKPPDTRGGLLTATKDLQDPTQLWWEAHQKWQKEHPAALSTAGHEWSADPPYDAYSIAEWELRS